MSSCKSINCNGIAATGMDFCPNCANAVIYGITSERQESLASKYPQYYKDVSDISELDVYATHKLFNIQDPSGCIQHSSKKLLLSGVRTGGKSAFKDIKEARDTLNRWLQLYPELG